MYRTVHRIEQVINGVREVLEPNSVVDDIANAEELLSAGAIVAFEAPEVTITTKSRTVAKKSTKAEPTSDSEFG